MSIPGRYTKVPQALRDERRWLVWALKDGKKPPVGDDGYPLADWQTNPLTFDDAMARLERLPFPATAPGGQLNAGLGLIHQGGIDLDGCRNPQTGDIDARAQAIVDAAPGWVEVSPSGKGLKVFFAAPEWLEINFEASPLTATLKKPLYFALSGLEPLRDGDPLADGKRALALIVDMIGGAQARKDKKQRQRLDPEGGKVAAGGQEKALFIEACRLRHNGWQENEISHALWGLVVAGRFPNRPGDAPWTFNDCAEKARSACRYEAGDAPPVDLERNKDGGALKNPENLRRIINAMGVEFFWDEFNKQKYMARNGKTELVTDTAINRLRIEIQDKMRLDFPKEMAFDTLDVFAKDNTVHPVREYLAGLEWDGQERLGKWLVTYADAEDSKYVRSIGRITLMAAVSRILDPGCKFDELLILESPQGFEKSTALRTLCPDPAWFTDSLPLGSDAKLTMERTTGIWLVEAAEMHGYGRREVAHLKQFLSTQTDGPVRMAYGREPVAVPRQFIVIGTTNQSAYLRDPDGNRRYWPVRVGRLKVMDIARDRDQLWAEALFCVRRGDSIRLERELWQAAGEQQAERRPDDAWAELLDDMWGQRPGKVQNLDIWKALEIEVGRTTAQDIDRLGAVMRRLGFDKGVARFGGQSKKCWVRRGPDDRERRPLVNLATGKLEADDRSPGDDEEVPF